MVPSAPFDVSIDVVPMRARVRVSCSHRLKRLEKSDRRVLGQIFPQILSWQPSPSSRDTSFHPSDLISSMDVCFPSDGSAGCHHILTEIGETFDKVLHIEDGEASEKSIHVAASGNLNVAPAKCLNKCATFPLSGETKLVHSSSQEADELPGSEDRTSDVYSRSNSLPPSLLSALKGSREKHGATIGKLTVKWAPDVYDPPPTSVSHFLNRGSKKKAAKKDKNGKKGHKGKGSSKAAGSKKKQLPRRISGSTNRCYNLPVDDYACVVIPQGVGNLEIGCPETCGSSYFMNSLERVHYSAAEAL